MQERERKILKFNSTAQPVAEFASCLSGFLGELALDVNLFPISYESWKKVPTTDKEKCYKDFILILSEQESSGYWDLFAKHWRDGHSELFKEYYKEDLSREDNFNSHSNWIPREMWIAFIDYCLQLDRKVKLQFIQ